MEALSKSTVLANGIRMPWLGFGTYKIPDGKEVEDAVLGALESGYRSIDTAELYENEKGVGRAVRSSGLDRKDIFIATKVWNTNQGYDETLKSFDRSLKNLGVDYIDLYLIHWPVKVRYQETWRALERIYRDGLARSIGVSNFTVGHLEILLKNCEVRPHVNQVEFHPFLFQKDLLDYCNRNDIRVEAWRPLLRGEVSEIPLLCEIGGRYRKTPAQIALRWLLQLGIVVIPKSVRRERMIENSRIFDFELADSEMNSIGSLNRNMRLGPDPDSF